jgi:hypothetical protein
MTQGSAAACGLDAAEKYPANRPGMATSSPVWVVIRGLADTGRQRLSVAGPKEPYDLKSVDHAGHRAQQTQQRRHRGQHQNRVNVPPQSRRLAAHRNLPPQQIALGTTATQGHEHGQGPSLGDHFGPGHHAAAQSGPPLRRVRGLPCQPPTAKAAWPAQGTISHRDSAMSGHMTGPPACTSSQAFKRPLTGSSPLE